jgi:hypothetical protein
VAVDEDYILAMSQGTSWVAAAGTAAPTGMATPSTPYVDLGAMSTDGLTETLSQSRTEFKRWGSIAVFKTVITDQKHVFKVKFLESKPAVLGLFYRTATPTPDATTHIITVTDDTTGKLDPRTFVFDVLDGTNHARFYCPNAEVTNTDAPVYKTDGLVEYGVEITAYPDNNGVAVARTYLLDAVVAG